MKKQIFSVIIFIYLKLHLLSAQVEIPFKYYNLEFKEYIDLVKTHNLEYAAEKLNINISEAAIEVAKIFKDPYISMDLTENSENRSETDYGLSSEIGKTIELGGKRKARIDLSRSENELAKALVTEYFRNLQAEATLAYLEGMKQKQLFMVRYDSYQTMKKLHEADSIRFKLGSIMEIDVIQSKLEAGILLNESIHAIAEWKNSLTKISLMTGTSKNDTLFLPSSHLHDAFREFSLNNLIMEALSNRADLLAAILNREVSQKNLILARKERNTDLDLKLGVSNSWFIGGASPTSTGITAGIAVPLKFSNFYRGELQIAQVRVQQSEALFNHAELQVRNEILQAWELYQDYCKQVENFDKGLLENAENVRKGKIYSYQRGETSLLDVLNAQRTYNDIQTTYYEALFNRAAALVELEKAAGIWDIYF
jgi:outer membrane protein, heavy metal efflux system